MAKKKTNSIIFKCTCCGNTQPKWLGRCPECNEWNSFEEFIEETSSAKLPFSTNEMNLPIPLSSVTAMEDSRFLTGISEFDRVLGEGAMKRSAILIGGEPGIGKSTLLLQTISSLNSKGRVLYISGEESASQIKSRADRLGIKVDNIEILCTSLLSNIETTLKAINPIFVIIDSIQTIYSPEAGVIPGTINQLKYCTNSLISWVKERDAVMFLVAHITKEGQIAGPKSLEHMVDTVISFERNDEEIRFLRVQKNRFGSTDEIGIFSMTEKGLIPLEDPSSLFTTRRQGTIPAGIAIVPVFEGSRVFLVEIQALTVAAKGAYTRVYSDNIDNARISRIAAVLEKRLGICFSDQDIYINVAGGIRLTETAIDGAIAAALYSARTDIPISSSQAIVGEISLAGEFRPVNRLKQRIKAGTALGYKEILSPIQEDAIIPIGDIKSLIRKLFETKN